MIIFGLVFVMLLLAMLGMGVGLLLGRGSFSSCGSVARQEGGCGDSCMCRPSKKTS